MLLRIERVTCGRHFKIVKDLVDLIIPMKFIMQNRVGTMSLHTVSLLFLIVHIYSGGVGAISFPPCQFHQRTVVKADGTIICQACQLTCDSGFGLDPPCFTRIRQKYPVVEQCLPCKNGINFSEGSDTSSCKSCPSCPKNVIIQQNCTARQPTICTRQCKYPYYYDNGYCVKCCPCSSGLKKDGRCRNIDPSLDCSTEEAECPEDKPFTTKTSLTTKVNKTLIKATSPTSTARTVNVTRKHRTGTINMTTLLPTSAAPTTNSAVNSTSVRETLTHPTINQITKPNEQLGSMNTGVLVVIIIFAFIIVAATIYVIWKYCCSKRGTTDTTRIDMDPIDNDLLLTDIDKVDAKKSQSINRSRCSSFRRSLSAVYEIVVQEDVSSSASPSASPSASASASPSASSSGDSWRNSYICACAKQENFEDSEQTMVQVFDQFREMQTELGRLLSHRPNEQKGWREFGDLFAIDKRKLDDFQLAYISNGFPGATLLEYITSAHPETLFKEIILNLNRIEKRDIIKDAICKYIHALHRL